MLCYHFGVSGTRGKFITFEGLDGCGKSTQMNRLAEVLRGDGIDVVTARQPGGTPIAEQIRSILLNSRTTGLAPLTELALMARARSGGRSVTRRSRGCAAGASTRPGTTP